MWKKRNDTYGSAQYLDFLIDGVSSEPLRLNCEVCNVEMIYKYYVSRSRIEDDDRIEK